MSMQRIGIKLTILFVSIVLTLEMTGQSVDEIRFLTEYYPPYNYMVDDRLKGISVDLVEAILVRLDSQQTRDDIQQVPWARGFNELLRNREVSLFSITRSESREDKFQWVGPIASNTISLMARKDRNIRIVSIDHARRYKMGAVIDDIGEHQLVDRGIPLGVISRIGGVTVIHQAMQMLDLGRIDVFAYDEEVFKWELKDKGQDPGDYEAVFVLEESDLYIAFHKYADVNLVLSFQNALDELKKDGTYNAILSQYAGSIE